MITHIEASTCPIDKIFHMAREAADNNEYFVILLDFDSLFDENGELRKHNVTFLDDINSLLDKVRLIDFFIFSEKNIEFIINSWRISGLKFPDKEIVNQLFFQKYDELCYNIDNFVSVKENMTSLFLSKIINDRTYNHTFAEKIKIFSVLSDRVMLMKYLMSNNIENNNTEFIIYSNTGSCSSKAKSEMLNEFLLSLYKFQS